MFKKKLVVGLLTVGIAVGAVGTGALAKENIPSADNFNQMWENGIPSLNEMLPFMKDMHPSTSEEVLEDMYQSCHGDGEEGTQTTETLFRSTDMMNNF